MKQVRSGKKLLLRIFCIMLAVTLLCLLICGQYALYTATSELEYCNEAALDLYFDGLNHTMNELKEFNEDMYTSDYNFIALATNRNSLSISENLHYQWNLRRLLQNRTSNISGSFIFSQDEDVYYYCFGSNFLNGTITHATISTMQQIKDYWINRSSGELQVWTPFETQGHTLLMNTICRKDLYICSMVDLSAYSNAYSDFDSTGHIEYAFYTKDALLTNRDYVEANNIRFGDITTATEKKTYSSFGSHILQSRFNPEIGIGLCGIISMTGLWGNLKILVIILGSVLVIICLLFFLMYTTLSRMLIYPLNQITTATRQIAEEGRFADSKQEQIQELEDIRHALTNLVDQKVTLEKDNISQAHQKEHALLQYYQLQTRSHFFLNCLKSIYNLTSRGELEKTQQMITLFSNHIRYVFHDSLSFVTVQAELDEVNDYFRILQLERSDVIVMNQNIDPRLLDFPIPPLIIQTFLENFNKFNAPGSKILRFSIRVDTVDMEGAPYVRLRLTDNGIGYSDDALKKLESRSEIFERYHVGIQNLCRRMDILYKDKYRVAFFNNPTGGASSVIYLPIGEKQRTLLISEDNHECTDC